MQKNVIWLIVGIVTAYLGFSMPGNIVGFLFSIIGGAFIGNNLYYLNCYAKEYENKKK
jgi:hypothetical protein